MCFQFTLDTFSFSAKEPRDSACLSLGSTCFDSKALVKGPSPGPFRSTMPDMRGRSFRPAILLASASSSADPPRLMAPLAGSISLLCPSSAASEDLFLFFRRPFASVCSSFSWARRRLLETLRFPFSSSSVATVSCSRS